MAESSAFAAMKQPNRLVDLIDFDPFKSSEKSIRYVIEGVFLGAHNRGQGISHWMFCRTNYPERARDLWPGTCDDPDLGGDGCTMVARRFDNIALGVTVRTQSDADRLIPDLLGLSDLVGLLWIDLQPREAIDLDSLWRAPCPHCIDGLHDPGTNVVECVRCESTGIGEEVLIDWLHISGDGEPLHPNWVRKPLHDAVEAGVPVWMESIILDGRVWRQLPPWGEFQTGSEA